MHTVTVHEYTLRWMDTFRAQKGFSSYAELVHYSLEKLKQDGKVEWFKELHKELQE